MLDRYRCGLCRSFVLFSHQKISSPPYLRLHVILFSLVWGPCTCCRSCSRDLFFLPPCESLLLISTHRVSCNPEKVTSQCVRSRTVCLPHLCSGFPRRLESRLSVLFSEAVSVLSCWIFLAVKVGPCSDTGDVRMQACPILLSASVAPVFRS